MSKAPAQNDRISAEQRLLNLFFLLNTSPHPVPTSRIVTNAELGYTADDPRSAARMFKRDRDALAGYGVVVKRIEPESRKKNEESSWAIDEAGTHMARGIITRDDYTLLISALEVYLARDDIAYRPVLSTILCKLITAAGASYPTEPSRELGSSVERTVWSAFSTRKKLRFRYVNASGTASERTVDIYGILSEEGNSLFVGLDSKSGEIRHFRCDRVTKTWAPKEPYAIPADFDASSYLYLPFDISSDPPVPATFSFPLDVSENEILAVTKNRGTLERDEACSLWFWHIEVCDERKAAAYSLLNTNLGMLPVSPASLVSCRENLIFEAVSAHE